MGDPQARVLQLAKGELPAPIETWLTSLVVLRKYRRLLSRRLLHKNHHPPPHGTSLCDRTKSLQRHQDIHMGSSLGLHTHRVPTNIHLLPDSYILGSFS